MMKNVRNPAGFGLFIPMLIIAIALAYFVPGPGMIQQPISLTGISGYGVSVLFFFYGLKLNTQKLKQGLSNWRMHILIHATSFLVFPLLALAIQPAFVTEEARRLWLGIFFLSTLPSTVSSSVVMVSIAGGNIPAAIFNASISALIGVIVTPLWIGIFLHFGMSSFDAADIFMKLMLQVLLPVVIGLLLNRRFGRITEKYKRSLSIFDQIILLLIVYTSFCKSFTGNLFETLSFPEIMLLAAGMLGLFLLIMLFTRLVSKLLNFSRGDTITVMFCGSKKSLVHGTVMSGILFAGSPLAGFILLPLMLYHALQILAASLLANKIASLV